MKTPTFILLLLLIIMCIACENTNTKDSQAGKEETKAFDSIIDEDLIETSSLIVDSISHSTPGSVSLIEKEKQDLSEPEKAVADTVPHKEKPKSISRPLMKFEKSSHDFGTIAQGDVVDVEFTFVNAGNAPLVIKKADASCGCTHPSYPFLPIEPNESGKIGVRYDSKGKEGNQRPIITLYTNARPSEINLYLTGVVVVED